MSLLRFRADPLPPLAEQKPIADEVVVRLRQAREAQASIVAAIEKTVR